MTTVMTDRAVRAPAILRVRGGGGAVLQVNLLGEQTVVDGDGRVRLRSSRTIALLAFLVTRGGVPQSRQRIAGLFWPDSTDEQALTNLRRELHHLRAALDDTAALVVTARDLCWQDTPDVAVDVRGFVRERGAALAAARADDPAGVLAHAAAAVDALPRRVAARQLRRTGCSTSGPSSSSSASDCSTCSATPGSSRAT